MFWKKKEKLNVKDIKKRIQDEIEKQVLERQLDIKKIDMKALKEFKAFISRGNVINLSTAVVIGAAFTNLVNSLANNIITPLMRHLFIESAATSQPSHFNMAAFGADIFNFAVVAVILYIVVKVVTKISNKLTHKIEDWIDPYHSPEPPATKQCIYCCMDIPVAAIRCPHCVSDLN